MARERERKPIPVDALDCLSLVQHHVVPLQAIEELEVLNHNLVTGDDYVETGFSRPKVLSVEEFAKILSFFWIAPVWYDLMDCRKDKWMDGCYYLSESKGYNPTW